jgi:hypothetical protein
MAKMCADAAWNIAAWRSNTEDRMVFDSCLKCDVMFTSVSQRRVFISPIAGESMAQVGSRNEVRGTNSLVTSNHSRRRVLRSSARIS